MDSTAQINTADKLSAENKSGIQRTFTGKKPSSAHKEIHLENESNSEQKEQIQM